MSNVQLLSLPVITRMLVVYSLYVNIGREEVNTFNDRHVIIPSLINSRSVGVKAQCFARLISSFCGF